MNKVFATLVALFLATPAFAQVTVQGKGTVYATPDCATLRFNVVTESKTAKAANESNRTASSALFATLKKAGVDEKDVSTTAFDVSPRYSYQDKGEAKFLGYTVTHGVSVNVKKLSDVGQLVDDTVNDSVRLRSIAFHVSNRKELEVKARNLALADAKKKGQQLVAGLNSRLGNLKSVSESVERSRGAYDDDVGESRFRAQSTTIAAGEQAITVNVNVTWEVSDSFQGRGTEQRRHLPPRQKK